ncbi:MAG TPA: DoxX family protein [Methylocella sp.]|nr:DoxX family protein [Methylocella sp.]
MTRLSRISADLKPHLLSALRVVTALLLIQHGTAKLFHFPQVAMFDNLNLFSLMGAAGFIEFIGGILLFFGIYTRPVAFILSGEMAVAYFLVHAPKNFFPILNQGELAVLYCFVLLYLAAAGGGAWKLPRR